MIIAPSKRIECIEEYYFSKKLKQVQEMNATDPKNSVINLGIGSPDLRPHRRVIQRLSRFSKKSENHGYQAYIGIEELRKAMSDFYQKKYSVDLNPKTEVLPLIGSKEGIFHVSMAFLNPGDEVLLPDPGYPTYTSITKLVGAKPVYYDLSLKNNWLPDFDTIQKQITENTKIIWINYPHMPTGTMGNIALFEKWVVFAKKNKVLLVHDNPYSFILNPEPLSIFQVDGAKDVAIELNSLSKSHNMAGWRVGMALGKKEYLQAILKVKSNIDSGSYKPIQLAAVNALNLKDSWFNKNNSIYAKRKKYAEKFFDLLNVEYSKNQAGLFLWGKIKNQDSEAFIDNLLIEKKVFITPGTIFGDNGKGFVRISLCMPISKIKEAINRLK